MSLSHLATTAALMGPGEWRLLCQQGDGSNYGPPIWPATVGNNMNDFGYVCGYDNQVDRKRVITIGQGHSGAVTDMTQFGFNAYDIPTNHWMNLRTAPPPSIPSSGGNGHPYGLTCCVPSERLFMRSEANTCRWEAISTDRNDLTTWTTADWFSYPSPPAYADHNGRGWIVNFPERDSLIMFVPDVGIVLEKKHTEVGWRSILTISPAYQVEGSAAAYSPVYKKVMFGGGNNGTADDPRFWIYDAAAGSVPTLTTPMPSPGGTGPQLYFGVRALFWADPVTGDFLVLSNRWSPTVAVGFHFWKYNPPTNAWTRLTTQEASVPSPFGLEYQPDGPSTANFSTFSTFVASITDMGVSMFVGPKVWLYKHATNGDASGLSFARKYSMPGVVAAYGFDSNADVRNVPHPAAYPLRYWNSGITGSCIAALGAGYPIDYSVRGSGEANARSASYGAICYRPEVDTAVYNTLGGGTGALRITIPSQSDQGVGGWFDTPYLGTDVTPKVNLGPHNFGRVWYQVMMRTQGMTAANLAASMVTGGTGAKLLVGGSIPPFAPGGDIQCAADLIIDIKKNTIFSGYSYFKSTMEENFQLFDRTVGANTLVQNVVACIYTGGAPSSYVNPPCVMVVPNTWQQVTWHFELRPAATDFTISGNNLTKAGLFTADQLWYTGRWVYIQQDATGSAAFFRIHSKTSNDTVVLTNSNSNGATGLPNVIAGTPPAGSNKSVVISSYWNSIVEVWIDGLKIFSLTDQPIHWDGTDIAAPVPGGFGAMKITPQMTNKDSSVVHSEAYCWYDDLIISTEPIPMSQSTVVTAPSTPAAPCLPWMLK